MTIPLETKFKKLTEDWIQETRFLSSAYQRFANAHCQEILSFGEDVIPLILQELVDHRGKPHDWFLVLYTLTCENPVPEEYRGKFPEMAESWIQWGRDNGYLDEVLENGDH